MSTAATVKAAENASWPEHRLSQISKNVSVVSLVQRFVMPHAQDASGDCELAAKADIVFLNTIG